MRKNKEKIWEFEGNFYEVGNSLNESPQENSIFPLVYFEGKLYKAIVKPDTNPNKPAKIGLWDIYYPNKKLYWVTANRVFQIIKQTNEIQNNQKRTVRENLV